MNNITFIAGSLPSIVTTGSQRRVNKNGLDDPFLKQYISLLSKLLLAKKSNLNDLNIVYIGGYQNQDGNENVNTAKLYFSALQYYFKELGYGNLNKVNFTIIDEVSLLENEEGAKEKLENMDFLFLGIGQDKLFGELLTLFQNKNISIKDIVLRNHIVVASVCAGSVVSAQKIYGGSYDTFYYKRPSFLFPSSYETLGMNPVTMEPNYASSSKDDALNQEFRDTCLIPDSYQIAFFACRANSMIPTIGKQIYAIGSISLFISGREYIITHDGEVANITYLNSLVQQYNQGVDKLFEIQSIIESLERSSYEANLCQDSINTFLLEEKSFQKEKAEKVLNLKNNIKEELLTLFQTKGELSTSFMSSLFLDSLNLEGRDHEVYLKYYLIAIIKKYSREYSHNYPFYYAIIYEAIQDLASVNSLIPYYFVQCFSSFYPNGEMKKLLRLTNMESSKRVNELSQLNQMRKRLKG